MELYNQKEEQDSFNLYMSEMLRSITNSISAVLGGGEFDMSWKQLEDYEPETRTPEEIKTQILDKLKKL